MKKVLWFTALMMSAVSSYASNCYVGLAGGKSSVGISGIDSLERRIVPSRYVTGSISEDSKSNTVEVLLGCILSKRYGVKVEVGLLEGFKHSVKTRGVATFEGYTADFDFERVIRARGYSFSFVFEKQLSSRSFVFVDPGVVYVQATGDIYPLGAPYSIHGTIPFILP